ISMGSPPLELLCVGYRVIVCGDFNTITEEHDRISPTALKIKHEGKTLSKIIDNSDVSDVYRHLYPTTTDFTRYDGKAKTRIDRLYKQSRPLRPI
uniref:Endonuclease/exonuclease/phosphatase domain-containing protein n=1 Tax=Esox lucius TaxID=8010 RepID=A0AAY5L4I5_ESOLU